MKKYAFAGAGGRATTMFAVPLAKEYGDVAQIVGVFDPNRKRCEALAKRTETEIPLYTDFDTMLEETKPDVVIVATVDRYHHCLLYTSPSPRDPKTSRMPSSA